MLREFLKKFIDSLNPNIYTPLSASPLKNSIKFFFQVILIFSLLNSFFFLPSIYDFYSNFNENFEKIEAINSSIKIKTTEPIIISSKPLIVIDSKKDFLTDEYLLITDNMIYKKGWFKNSNITTDNINFADKIKNSKTKIILLMILSLPTIFFLYFILNIVKYAFMILIIFFIALCVIKIINYPLFTKQVINASIYSLSIYLITRFFLRFTIGYKSLLPFILYVIWFIIVLLLMTESKVSFTREAFTSEEHIPKRNTCS